MSRAKIIILISPVLFAFALATSPTQAANAAKVESSKTKLKMAPTETAIYVADMHCKNCAKKVARKLYTVKGVVKVRTDLKADVAIVTPQKKKQLDPLALWSAAQASGFPATKLIGPSGTYLPHPETKTPEKQPEAETTAANAG